jgi:hypothetical protein
VKTIPITQFLRPNAEKRPRFCDVADDVYDRYMQVVEPLGLQFTAECVPGGFVSICLEEPTLGDFACQLAINSPKDPGLVRKAVEAMVRKFDAEEFKVWMAEMNDDSEWPLT